MTEASAESSATVSTIAGGIAEPWVIGLILLGLLIGALVGGAARVAKYRPGTRFRLFRWLRLKELVPFSTVWSILLLAAAVYTLTAFLISVVFVYFTSGYFYPGWLHNYAMQRDFFQFPGFVFVILGGWLAMASVINTICLLNAKVNEIYTFTEIGEAIGERVREWQEKSSRENLEAYLIDYVPVIGAISDPRASEEIIRQISEWPMAGGVRHMIFLASTEHCSEDVKVDGVIADGKVGPMERAIESMVLRSENDNKAELYKDMICASLKKNETLDTRSCAVWISDRINFEHYMVDGVVAMQYYVTPSEPSEESVNQVRGAVQNDARHVRYLREVCRTYLRQAISPRAAETQQDSATNKWKTRFSFDVGQFNIATGEVFFFGERKSVLTGQPTPLPMEIDGSVLKPTPHEYEVETAEAPAWIRVKLWKGRKIGEGSSIPSPESFFVEVKKVT